MAIQDRNHCGTCLFNQLNKECRRFPPQVVYDSDSDTFESMFPEVNDDWCGEWRSRSE